MNYFLTHYQYLKDGQTVISPTAQFDSKDMAISDWHSKMSSNMVSDDVLGCLTIIHTSNGQIVLNDYWQREVQPTVIETAE